MKDEYSFTNHAESVWTLEKATHSFSKGLEAGKCMEGPGSRDLGGNVAEFRGAAGKGSDLGSQGCHARELGHCPVYSDEPLEGSEQGNDSIIFGFWCSESGFLARGGQLLGAELRGSIAEWLSAHMLKASILDLNPQLDTCWQCGLKEETSLWALVSTSATQI